MVSFTHAELAALVSGFVWPFARILALVGTGPVLGNTAIPVRARIGLAVLITILVAPLVREIPAVEPWSAAGIAILVEQVIIGTAMGMVMRMVFTMVDVAGELAGLQMGLGFATFFDPQNAASVPIVSQFLGLLATLVFLSLNGHLLLISVLADSFATLPIGASFARSGVALAVAEWGGAIFAAGLTLALPVVAALLIANMALGVLTRAVPQLNIFAVGFPVTLLLGFAALMLSLPHLTPVLARLLEGGLSAMSALATLGMAR